MKSVIDFLSERIIKLEKRRKAQKIIINQTKRKEEEYGISVKNNKEVDRTESKLESINSLIELNERLYRNVLIDSWKREKKVAKNQQNNYSL